MGQYRTEGAVTVGSGRSESAGFELLQAQAEASGVALLVVNDDGFVLFHNSAFSGMWGLAPDSLAGKSTADLVQALTQGDEAAATLAGLLTESDRTRRGEMTAPDGRVIEWGAAETADGRAKAWTFRDVSLDRNSLRALRDAENWLRMFAAHSEGVILELDTSARIVGLWMTSSAFFDRPETELHGRTLREVLPEPHGRHFDTHIRAVIATGRPEAFEYVIGTGTERRVFTANAVLLPGHEGYATTVTVLIRDMTARARLQQQVLQSERLASLGVLAAGVAHEINNPLGYMLINLERVRRVLRSASTLESAPVELVTCLDMAIEGTSHVQRIVNDLRRYSRSGDDEPRAPLDVRRVLAFTLDLTRTAIEERARLVAEFAAVPPVIASEGRLSQVLLNLVVNAVQAIPEGAPERHEVRVRTYTDEQGNAVVEVRDTGDGIPDKQLEEIFDPFFTTKPPGVGTGLGLAICQNIVTSFGGDITVDSKVGVGSVFRVLLPAAGDSSPSQG